MFDSVTDPEAAREGGRAFIEAGAGKRGAALKNAGRHSSATTKIKFYSQSAPIPLRHPPGRQVPIRSLWARSLAPASWRSGAHLMAAGHHPADGDAPRSQHRAPGPANSWPGFPGRPLLTEPPAGWDPCPMSHDFVKSWATAPRRLY